jgi:hypothetical protein
MTGGDDVVNCGETAAATGAERDAKNSTRLPEARLKQSMYEYARQF